MKKKKIEEKTVTTTTTTTTVISSAPKEVYDVFVLDRSGSMGHIWETTVDGVNEYIVKSQRTAKDTGIQSYLSLLKFDDVLLEVLNCTPIADVQKLDYVTEGPRGGTALYDAIGSAINTIKQKLAGRENDPLIDVTVTVFTDGYENSSKEFKHPTVSALIKDVQNKYNWTVAFVGAGGLREVTRTATGLGVLAANTLNYVADISGTSRTFTAMACARATKSASFADTGAKCNSAYFAPDGNNTQ